MKILVVDDEQDICEILQFNLVTEGYEVVTANSAEQALTLLTSQTTQTTQTPQTPQTPQTTQTSHPLPDLILLDIMMGKMSGLELAARLKADPATAAIPIIFTTALDGEEDTVRGLNIGADDYIAKPLSMREVKARVKAVLRRTSLQTAPVNKGVDSLQFGTLSIHPDAKTASLDGVELVLTKLEYELLSLLLQNPGHVYSREELLHLCWPQDVYVLDRTVDVNITRLRKKIGRYADNLCTKNGYGYFWKK